MYSFEDNKISRTQDQSGLGVTETEQCSLRMVGFPSVNTQDIIVDGSRRYLLKDVQPVIFPGTSMLTIQTIQAQALAITDPVFQLETPQ